MTDRSREPGFENLSRLTDEELEKMTSLAAVAERAKRRLERLNNDMTDKHAGTYTDIAAAVGAKAVEAEFTVLPPDAIVGRKDGVSTGGEKNDAGKPPMALLPFEALTEVAKVLGHGASRYTLHNWRRGIGYHRLLDASLRRISAFTLGEGNDPETGLSHLAHAA